MKNATALLILGVALAVAVLGAGIVLYGTILAYDAYMNYVPVLPRVRSLDEAITNTAYELVNLVIKLGFLGVMIGAGGLLTKRGLFAAIEAHRLEKGAETCSGQQK